MKNKRIILKELKNTPVAIFDADINEVILFGSRANAIAYKNSESKMRANPRRMKYNEKWCEVR